MPDFSIQIDVKEITQTIARCNMYTGPRCVEIVMSRSDYDALVYKGFFIRNGKEKDSAGLLNTTAVFVPE